MSVIASKTFATKAFKTVCELFTTILFSFFSVEVLLIEVSISFDKKIFVRKKLIYWVTTECGKSHISNLEHLFRFHYEAS